MNSVSLSEGNKPSQLAWRDPIWTSGCDDHNSRTASQWMDHSSFFSFVRFGKQLCVKLSLRLDLLQHSRTRGRSPISRSVQRLQVCKSERAARNHGIHSRGSRNDFCRGIADGLDRNILTIQDFRNISPVCARLDVISNAGARVKSFFLFLLDFRGRRNRGLGISSVLQFPPKHGGKQARDHACGKRSHWNNVCNSPLCKGGSDLRLESSSRRMALSHLGILCKNRTESFDAVHKVRNAFHAGARRVRLHRYYFLRN